MILNIIYIIFRIICKYLFYWSYLLNSQTSHVQNISTNLTVLQKYQQILIVSNENDFLATEKPFDPEFTLLLKDIVCYASYLILAGFSLFVILNFCKNLGLLGFPSESGTNIFNPNEFVIADTQRSAVESALKLKIKCSDNFSSPVFYSLKRNIELRDSCMQVNPEEILNTTINATGDLKFIDQPILLYTSPLEMNICCNWLDNFYLIVVGFSLILICSFLLNLFFPKILFKLKCKE